MIVIGLIGKMQSGKNTVANFLEKEFIKQGLTVYQTSFAKHLKLNLYQDFEPAFNLINQVIKNITSLIPRNYAIAEELNKLSAPKTAEDFEPKSELTRIFLQRYGTEVIRNRVSNQYWTAHLKNEIDNLKVDIVLITDVRFLNEFSFIQTLEPSYLIKIIREKHKYAIESTHSSEYEIEWITRQDKTILNLNLESLASECKIVANDILNLFTMEAKYE